MKKAIILTILSVLAIGAHALDVVNTAGSLSSKVSDLNVRSLKVTGTMDANDFYFIADNLHQLTDLDLEGVEITACQTPEFHYWTRDFQAGEVPVAAFGGMRLSSVKLPAGATAVGRAAFACCGQLEHITFPTALDSIADYAFAGCAAIKTVTLPASVRIVGVGAFMRCSALTTFAVEPSSRLSRLDATALMDCPSLASVSLGRNVERIGERVLAGAGLREVDLTASTNLSTIDDWAMVKMPVTTVKLPSSVTTVGDGAFLYDTELKGISLGGHVASLNDYLLAGTGLTDLDLTGVTVLGDYALYQVSTLSVVELPETVTWLGSLSMAGMTGLTELHSDAEVVPDLGEDVWKGVNQGKVLLKVPAASLEDYKAAEQWKLFLFESSWLKGDVNGDGEINIADINMIVYIIQGHVYKEDIMLRADVDGNGEINISDVNAVLSIMMGPTSHAPAIIDTDSQLHLDDLSIKPGEERTLNIMLDGDGTISALQCDINLPQGLTLVSSAVTREHVQETCCLDELTTRAAVYSLTNSLFDAEQQTVLSITVKADASLSSESEIVLSHVVLADNNHVGWHAPDCVARVNNSTGIEDLNAVADRVWLEGRLLCIDTRHDGEAQLIAINGTSTGLQVTAGVNKFELDNGFYVVSLNGKSYKISVR